MTVEQHLRNVPKERCSCSVNAARSVPFRPGVISRCATCDRLYRWRDELLRLLRTNQK